MNQNLNTSCVDGLTNTQTVNQAKEPLTFSSAFNDHAIMANLLHSDYDCWIGHKGTGEGCSVWDYVMEEINEFVGNVLTGIRLHELSGQEPVPIKVILHDSVILDEIMVAILLATFAYDMEPHWDLRVMWKRKYRDPEFFLVKPMKSDEVWEYQYDDFRMTESIWI